MGLSHTGREKPEHPSTAIEVDPDTTNTNSNPEETKGAKYINGGTRRVSIVFFLVIIDRRH